MPRRHRECRDRSRVDMDDKTREGGINEHRKYLRGCFNLVLRFSLASDTAPDAFARVDRVVRRSN